MFRSQRSWYRRSFIGVSVGVAIVGMTGWVARDGSAIMAPTPEHASAPSYVRFSLNNTVAQPVVVYGVVRDAGSKLVIRDVRVSLMVDEKTTAIGTTTGANGAYSLKAMVPSTTSRLTVQFRRFGYTSQTVTANANTDSIKVNVDLSAESQRLSEVAVATEQLRGAPAPKPAAVGKAGTAVRQFAGGYAQNATLPTAREHRALSTNDWNREQYDRINDNPFLDAKNNALSTFSIDVDRASYGNVRRFLTQGVRPPADAVRIEELVNYFPYSLNEPRGRDPVAITTEVTAAPWQPQHRLVRIALQAKRIETQRLPASNLVFLIDVSGSMSSPDKLPLVQSSMRLLVEQLRPQDHVAIVVYAGAAGLVLPSTSGEDKARIMAAIDRLEAGGSTAGGAGIELAYRTAKENFSHNGNNRVILATDGDFNVGASSDVAMERLIESKRAEGTYLTILGYGRGNYQDAKMEKMAKIGNGNYAYVDDLAEARKVLVQEMGATLVTVANDVKLQVEFNPALVTSYRLIGYEDRLLRNEDFNNDQKDAGDMGAGHTVTALYEIVPVGVHGTIPNTSVDSLRYTAARPVPLRRDQLGNRRDDMGTHVVNADELLFVKLRYKQPGESTSRLISQAVLRGDARARASDDFRFAAAVAEFGMVMRDSEFKGGANISQVLNLATGAVGADEGGFRSEFVQLVKQWRDIDGGVASRDRHDLR